MNERDLNEGNRQQGGFRTDESAWDSPRQANQWQSESSQAGGGWGSEDSQRSASRDTGRSASRDPDARYYGDPRDEGDSGWRERSHRGGRSGYGGRDRFERGSQGRGWGDRGYTERSHGGGYGLRDQGHWDRDQSRHGQEDRGYRFSGSREANYPSRAFDASGGNDYASFTSEDYGGRDFSSRGGGLSGGMSPSNSYRESYGPGSWSSRRDYGDWREYGESRGFLQRAGDEIASWFGDDEAARRREQDHRGRGPSDYTRSDERIREDINDALTHDNRLDATHIRVSVKSGEATLEGTVESRQDKRRAEDLADNVSGVRHVQNNLRVTSGTASSSSSGSGLTAGTSTPGYSHTDTTATNTGTGSTTGSGSGTSGSTGSTSASTGSTGSSRTS
ncbi:BON domain-containing protein [Novosphingobium soli]|uniref:BON domain-containing protein n=1 Tax=Novosphingobium soli TaxID=574956 RepID=A0ABV6CVI9_9SPHN